MEDYRSSALRHFEDAEFLRDSGRYDNAGHLVGFAAECAIKHRITTLRPGQGAPHGHLPDLLLAARKHTGQRNAFVAMHQLLKADIFHAWNVNRRYRGSGSTTVTELDEWFTCAKRILGAAGIVRK